MISKLSDGFEVHIDESALNDWAFLKTLRKIDKGETGLIVDIAELLLGGDEEVEKLEKHLADENGKTPADKMVEAIAEIMNSANESKNS